ncbi:MAG: hypothetical protein V7L01_24565 [Nostoc sp.]
MKACVKRSLWQTFVTKINVYIDTKKPLVIQRFLMINWMFLVVFKRSLIYEFSLVTCYTSLHQPTIEPHRHTSVPKSLPRRKLKKSLTSILLKYLIDAAIIYPMKR